MPDFAPEFEAPDAAESLPCAARVEELLAAGLLEAWPEFGAFGAAESVPPEFADPVAEPDVPEVPDVLALLLAAAPDLPGVEPELAAPDAVDSEPAESSAGEAEAVPPAGIGRVGAAGEGLSGRASPPATGLRSVVASGRASAAAGVAGSALSRAGFLSSFGSDTHYPSLRRNS
ncbi:hypothetical protein ACQPW1_46685 [Nocardia sp. CA-128927]|uniref:hypothetical protein n=1 Tax=Nocardia sp. CA-128927 TaxID=3239975 RepID=UPI003D961B07